MRILIATTSTGDTESIAAGLRYIGQHEISVMHYDQKSTQSYGIYQKLDPTQKAAVRLNQTAQYVTCDPELLHHAEDMRPDIILYISAWGSAFAPSNETLLKLRDMAPLVHLLFDGGDPPWWPILRKFEEEGLFDLTVSIDGNHDWPGGSDWQADWKIESGITLLTPISPAFYPEPTFAFSERPFPIGYAGNVGGWMRKGIVERLQQEELPFVLKLRDFEEYASYASFLHHCRIIVNVPFTGSGQRKHVKGRVIETALARACLLEWTNPHLRDWFDPRSEFEEYDNPDHCLEMCKFLMGQIKRCEEIGHALYTKVRQEHDPSEFWTQVFDRVTFRKKAAE
jgi:hypothetical protein